MKHFGEWLAQQRLRVFGAGRPAPLSQSGIWHSAADDGEPKGDTPTPADPPAPTPPAPPPAAPPVAPPKGPRNPWLPGGDHPAPPRRPASIDDIFRPKGSSGGGSGGNGSGGGPGKGNYNPLGNIRLPSRADGKSWLPLIVAGVLGLWVLSTSFHQLPNNEQGVVTTFGKYDRIIGPGASATLPWPVQDVETADVTRIHADTIPDTEAEKLMLTSDQNLVNLSYLVRWSIRDLKLYTFQLDNPDTTVRQVTEAAMRASVADVKLDDVMNGMGRAEITHNVRARTQAILDAYHSGIVIQGVDIKKADPPAKVNEAFQQVSAAQQDAASYISQAQAIAQKHVAQAQGEAAGFDLIYAQYRLAPEVTRKRMYYATMERVLGNNDKVLVGGNTTSYLPLPEIRRAATQADTSQGSEIVVSGKSGQGK